MATALKKKDGANTKLGRPEKGALSSYPKGLVKKIKGIRERNQGWGATSIVDELIQEHGYRANQLPHISSINRYLKETGLILQPYEAHGTVPKSKRSKVDHPHDLWEVDAQGAVPVQGIGYQAMINMKDSCSLKYCMAFPVQVRHQRHQPSTIHYLWAFRLAFEENGLPKAMQLDKDSVFYENQSKSPFPSRIQLWLIGLGVKVHFINVPPPLKQAKVERSHQTIDRQVLQGQHYKYWKALFVKTTKRRQRLNTTLPCKSLGNKAPLQAFSHAAHSGSAFDVQQEYDLLDLNRIYDFLDQFIWYRRLSKDKTLSLGGKIYYLKKAQPSSQIKVRFSKKTKRFIFRDVNERLLIKLPPKGLAKQDLIGLSHKKLQSMKYKLLWYRDFPLKT